MAPTKLGIGLPAMIPGVDPELIPRWAERADAGPFSSVATGELLTSHAYDILIALAVAATVSRRVRLLANVLVLPLHPAGVVAKQAASIDALSGGRLLLGLGVGARKPTAQTDLPDFAEAPAPIEGRYERFDEQIEHMRRIWRGETVVSGSPRVGPPPARPGGPELIVGGFTPELLAPAVRWATGMTTFGHVPDVERMARDFSVFRDAYLEAGHTQPPRLIATHYFALGPDAEFETQSYVERHLTHLSLDDRRKVAASISTTSAKRLRDVFRALVDAGATEIIPIPMIPDLDQLDRLSETLGHLAGTP